MSDPGPIGFLVLVPVKSTARGKSRLEAEPGPRRRLAMAMALDTVAAVAGASWVRGVLLLAEDADDGATIAAVSPSVTVHQVRSRGLNESIAEGLRRPDAAIGPVAVLPADLPSLVPGELDVALASAAALPFAVVADRDGTGTTLLAAARRDLLLPHYGPASLTAHLAAGAVRLRVPQGSGLRRDVDLSADLADVTGPRTAALLADLGATVSIGQAGAQP